MLGSAAGRAAEVRRGLSRRPRQAPVKPPCRRKSRMREAPREAPREAMPRGSVIHKGCLVQLQGQAYPWKRLVPLCFSRTTAKKMYHQTANTKVKQQGDRRAAS